MVQVVESTVGLMILLDQIIYKLSSFTSCMTLLAVKKFSKIFKCLRRAATNEAVLVVIMRLVLN